MDYFTAFAISASGMDVQKVRVDTVAMNIANANTSRTADGSFYQPLQVVVAEKRDSAFETAFQNAAGAQVIQVIPRDTPPRQVFEPGHPDADANGFVSYPNIDPVSEMVTLVEASRAYEANVRALNAAKTMALRALEIGR